MKKYNLSKIDENLAKIMFKNAFEYEPQNLTITLHESKKGLFAYLSLDNKWDDNHDTLELYSDGNIRQYCNGEPVSIQNLQEINHHLRESQWIDPDKELPDADCIVCVKTRFGIIMGNYNKKNNRFNFSGTSTLCIDSNRMNIQGMIIGWLSAENVVL